MAEKGGFDPLFSAKTTTAWRADVCATRWSWISLPWVWGSEPFFCWPFSCLVPGSKPYPSRGSFFLRRSSLTEFTMRAGFPGEWSSVLSEPTPSCRRNWLFGWQTHTAAWNSQNEASWWILQHCKAVPISLISDLCKSHDEERYQFQPPRLDARNIIASKAGAFHRKTWISRTATLYIHKISPLLYFGADIRRSSW